MNPNIEQHVENAIEHVEQLYERVTGQAAPASEGPYAEIPAERDPLQYVEEQMERLASALGAFNEMPLGIDRGMSRAWAPPVSVWEASDRYVICVDLPGVPRTGLSIALSNDTIEVSGDRPAPLDPTNGAQLRWTERPGGRFRRSIAIPPGARTDEMRAEMKDGVLEIRVPRATAPRSIPIG